MDKFVCIRTDYRNNDGILSHLPFKIGEIYEINVDKRSLSVKGYHFGLYESDGYFLRSFKDYFLSIEDFRTKQIDDILENI